MWIHWFSRFLGCYCVTPVTLFIIGSKGRTETQPCCRKQAFSRAIFKIILSPDAVISRVDTALVWDQISEFSLVFTCEWSLFGFVLLTCKTVIDFQEETFVLGFHCWLSHRRSKEICPRTDFASTLSGYGGCAIIFSNQLLEVWIPVETHDSYSWKHLKPTKCSIFN